MAIEKYTYSVNNHTANSAFDYDSFILEYGNSNIIPQEDHTNVSGDILEFFTKAELSVAEEATLDALLLAHQGITLEPDPTGVKIVEQIQDQPFAAKTLPDGRKLYVRETGIPKITIAAGAIGSLVFEIPYLATKLNGAMIIGCKMHDTANFKILDTDSGLLTTVPLYPVNQFGFSVNMPNDSYYKKYPYDADLFQGLNVCIEYTNNGTEEVTISVNLDLHEVKT